MDSVHHGSKPVVVILSTDKRLSALPDALWSAGIDSVLVSHWHDAATTLSKPLTCVAVVDADLPDVELAQIRVELPGTPVGGVLWLTPRRADPARDLLLAPDRVHFESTSKPISTDELIYRVKAMLLRIGAPTGDRNLRGLRPDIVFGQKTGQIVALFSTKGGVGKSFIAVNTAVGLTRFFGARTLLVDADLYYGDILALLDTTAQYSIADICNRQIYELDSLLAATTAHSSGIYLLPRPPAFERIDLLNKEVLVQALESYRSVFDYIVVNMSTPLDEFNLNIMDLADRVLLVTTPEIPAIQNTGRFLEISEKLGLADKTSLILNRANSGVDGVALAEQLHFRIATTVRSSGKLAVQMTNEGTSLFIRDARARQEITRDLLAVVEHVAGRSRPTRSPLVWLSSFLRRAA